MRKLTVNLVQQRVKSCTTELDKILQINVTGRELEDVSLLKTMTGVEILSLSVNHISRLSDFQFCKNLKELYLRHNKISELSEISYLKNLPKLRLLVLSENPCCEEPSYRMTVIKNLKHLTSLDGQTITLEERRQAQKSGLIIEMDPNENDAPEELDESSNNIKFCEPTQELQKAAPPKPVEQVDVTFGQPPQCQSIGKKAKEQYVQCETSSQYKIDNKESVTERYQRDAFKLPEQKIMLKAKRTNILSAILSLIKEVDYSGLQLIDAEIRSRLNALDIDLIFQEQQFLPKGNEIQ